MKAKVWYEIYGTANSSTANSDESILLAKVKSKGLAYIVAGTLKDHYKDVKIK